MNDPDAREVTRIELLMTADDPESVHDFLDRCTPGSRWNTQIRTAEVMGTVLKRVPLGHFEEQICTCVSIKLSKPVPVEPGMRLKISNVEDPTLTATGVVRPW